jgi:hypothetical protein
LVIQAGVIQNLQDGADSTSFRIGGGVDEPAKPGVDHRPGTHGAGFKGDKKLAARETIIAQSASGLAQGDDLGVRGRVQVAQNPILSAANNGAAFDHNRAYWDFAGRSRGASLVQGQRQRFSVRHAGCCWVMQCSVPKPQTRSPL